MIKPATRVFVLEPTKFSLEGLAAFGSVHYLFEYGEHRPGIWSPEFANEIKRRLEAHDFNSDTDFVAVVGHLVGIAQMVGNAVARYGRLNTLMFHAVDRNYVPLTIKKD